MSDSYSLSLRESAYPAGPPLALGPAGHCTFCSPALTPRFSPAGKPARSARGANCTAPSPSSLSWTTVASLALVEGRDACSAVPPGGSRAAIKAGEGGDARYRRGIFIPYHPAVRPSYGKRKRGDMSYAQWVTGLVPGGGGGVGRFGHRSAIRIIRQGPIHVEYTYNTEVLSRRRQLSTCHVQYTVLAMRSYTNGPRRERQGPWQRWDVAHW